MEYLCPCLKFIHILGKVEENVEVNKVKPTVEGNLVKPTVECIGVEIGHSGDYRFSIFRL